jgi:hypothetical protein
MGEGLPQVGCFMTQFLVYMKESIPYKRIETTKQHRTAARALHIPDDEHEKQSAYRVCT